jgi:hypothetical protein
MAIRFRTCGVCYCVNFVLSIYCRMSNSVPELERPSDSVPAAVCHHRGPSNALLHASNHSPKVTLSFFFFFSFDVIYATSNCVT